MRSLPIALLIVCALARAAGAVEPGTLSPQTHAWGDDRHAVLEKVFRKVLREAPVAPEPFLAYGDYRFITYDCPGRRTVEGGSNAQASKCGGQPVIAYGYGLFDMSRSEADLTFWLAHEVSHLALGHIEKRGAFALKTCKAWADSLGAEENQRRLRSAAIRVVASACGGGERRAAAAVDRGALPDGCALVQQELLKRVRTDVMRQCTEAKKDVFSEFTRGIEREADDGARSIMMRMGYEAYDADASLARAQDLLWVLDAVEDDDHDPIDARRLSDLLVLE